MLKSIGYQQILRNLTPKERLERLEALFSALAHPARRQILLAVQFRGGAMTAGEIAGRFKHAWATTTGHVKVLEQAGLLVQVKKGRSRVYSLDPAGLQLIEDWLGWFKLSQEQAEIEAKRRVNAYEKNKNGADQNES